MISGISCRLVNLLDSTAGWVGLAGLASWAGWLDWLAPAAVCTLDAWIHQFVNLMKMLGRSGAGVGVGMLRGAGDSFTCK